MLLLFNFKCKFWGQNCRPIWSKSQNSQKGVLLVWLFLPKLKVWIHLDKSWNLRFSRNLDADPREFIMDVVWTTSQKYLRGARFNVGTRTWSEKRFWLLHYYNDNNTIDWIGLDAEGDQRLRKAISSISGCLRPHRAKVLLDGVPAHH